MYRSGRARLGSSILLSPYEKFKSHTVEHVTGVLFTVLLCFVFMGLLLIVSQLVVFFGGHYFLKLWDEDEGVVTASYIYARPWMELIRLTGFALIFFFVMRGMKKKQR